MTFNVHHFHDPASRELAQRLVEEFNDTRCIPEPVDDTNWSGIRTFSEETQSWGPSVKWVRGTPRDLDQAVRQLLTAMELHGTDALYKRTRKGRAGLKAFDKRQNVNELHEELGVKRRKFSRGNR